MHPRGSARSRAVEAGIQYDAAAVDSVWHAWISRMRESDGPWQWKTGSVGGTWNVFFFFSHKHRYEEGGTWQR
jgi:hypothetical protein